MNLKRTPFWAASIGCALILAGSPLACGGGDDADANTGGDAGAPGDDDSTTGGKGSGGKGSTSSGGKGSTAGGGENLGGDTASGGKDTTGAGGGSNPTSASIADLISTLCDQEFDCCEEGELTYRFGSTADSAKECTKDFTYQYAESNEAQSPFPTLSGLLVTLGYSIDSTRVTENPKGIAECIAFQETIECPMLVETTPGRVYCTPGADVGSDPCALDNLFSPKLEAGAECTLALGEGGGPALKVALTSGANDIECVVGTTCLPADDPSNAKDYDACVTRGLKGSSCTKDVDCDYNLYCDSGDCTEKGDEGDDCSFNDSDVPMPGDENAGCKGGLSCSPVSLKCVASCEIDFPCFDNSQCPKDSSCRPMPIGDDSETWSLCQDIGGSAADLCDDDDDCVSGRYCDGAVCQEDNAIDEACGKDAMCEAGSYCAVYYCATLVQGGDVCTPGGGTNGGCVAKAKYCLSDTENSTPAYPTYLCATALRKAGEGCIATSECQTGLKCEVTTADAVDWPWTCTAGEKVGRDCDADDTTADALSCGAGLTCNADGKCEGQLDPGADCEDPEVSGTPRSDFCKNNNCVENWDEDGVDYICSDAPVPQANGGDGLTCGQ